MHKGKLAISDGNLFKAQQKKKKFIANTEKTHLFKQISIINGEEANFFTRCQQKNKSNQICKGKRVSNNSTEQMDIVCPQAMQIQFSEEIIIEILSMMPVRSILRFKSVSKSWKQLFSDPYFKMKHLSRAKNDQNSHKLLMAKKCHDMDVVYNLYSSTLSSAQVVEDEQKLDWPKPESSILYCCCDGLVLLAVLSGLDRHLLLWNPSTGESIVLPHPKSQPYHCVCGMGYDATIDDYKILAIDLDNFCKEVSVEILTLKGGSWKRICEYPAGIRRVNGFSGCGVYSLAFIHGAFHWVGGLSSCYTVVSFNISNEVYGEIPLLEHMCNIRNAKFIEHGVSVLGGMLCFHSTYFNPWGSMFKLWMMKDYGVKESWTELLTIQDDANYGVPASSIEYLRIRCDSMFVVKGSRIEFALVQGDKNIFYAAKPIYMYADGEVLLRCNYFGVAGSVYRTSREPFELLPQPPASKQGMVYTLAGHSKQGMVYTESLISPKSLI